MKKTELYTFNTYVAQVADGIEQDEARKMNKSRSNIRKNLKMQEWLEVQEAELNDMLSGVQSSLVETFKQTNNLDERFQSKKLQIKSDLHQVFMMPHYQAA